MANTHNSGAYISTAELKRLKWRLLARQHGGPQEPALAAAILHCLKARWSASITHNNRRLLRLVERIAEIELELTHEGGDVLQELEQPEHGRFGEALVALATHPLTSPKVPDHDPLLLRWQYSVLQMIADQHPLPPVPQANNLDLQRREIAERIGPWLQQYWERDRPFSEEGLCLCQYRHEAPTYQDLYGKGERYTTPENLFHRLLAHLHRATSHSAIEKDLTRWQQHERRM